MKGFIKKGMTLGLLVCMLVLIGCGNKNAAKGAADNSEKSLTMMFPGAGDEPGMYEPMLKPVLEKYFQETGIRVNCEFYSFDDIFQVIEVKIGSKSKDYDVIAVDVPMVAGYVNRGYLAPVDQYFSAEEKKQFVPSALNAGSWNGVFYSPPLSSSTALLWYNKESLTLDWYQSLYKDGISLRGYNGDEIGGLFQSGKVIFLIGGDWWTPAYHDDIPFEYTFAPVPAFKGYEDKVGTPTGSWHIGINNYSTRKDMAAEFIKWITIGEGHTLWIEACGELETTKSAINKILSDPNADPVKKIAAYEAMNTAVPRALTPGYSEYSTILDAMWEDVRNGSDVKNSLSFYYSGLCSYTYL
jgi:ABC-type glycerol-3-phosphate transport system substrate-binding protein